MINVELEKNHHIAVYHLTYNIQNLKQPGVKTENRILELTFDFSLQIIALYRELVSQKEFVLSKQLLRSGTSIGANVEEANAAQSKREFISKMSIASKEARETRYWLRLLDKSKMVNLNYTNHLASVEHIINILTKIVKTAQVAILNAKT